MSLQPRESVCRDEFVIASVADLLVSYLHQLEVKKVFGIPGGALEPLSDALGRAQQQEKLQVIGTRNENGAVYMAQAYGQASGTLGVCFVTTGPGATNALTAVASAYAEEVPLLLLSAQNSQQSVGRRPFQDSSHCGVDTVAMFDCCTRYNARVEHPQQLERHLLNAVQHAFGVVKGPVHLSLPGNLLASEAPYAVPQFSLPALLARQQRTVSLEPLAERLALAKNIVFIVGDGVEGCGDEVLQLADRLNARVLSTPAAKGMLDNNHACYRGVCGFAGHPAAFDILSRNEEMLLLLIGTALDEWDIAGNPEILFAGKEVIHLDAVPQHLYNSPMASMHLCAEVSFAIDQLQKTLRHRRRKIPHNEPPASPISFRDRLAEIPGKQSMLEPVHPKMLIRQLSRHWPADAICFSDVGNSSAWAIHYLQMPTGRERNTTWFKTTTRFAAMGWGLGQAIGHALASPQQKVVCLLGDGAMLMNGQEISVAQELSLNVLFVVLNDSSYGMVRHGQAINQAQSVGNALPRVDFSQLAAAQGVTAWVVNSQQELLQLDWEKVMSAGPALLDVRIDGDAVPPIDVRTRMIKEGNL